MVEVRKDRVTFHCSGCGTIKFLTDKAVTRLRQLFREKDVHLIPENSKNFTVIFSACPKCRQDELSVSVVGGRSSLN